MGNPTSRSPFDKIDDKIGQMLDRSMAALTEALMLMGKREKLHQVRFENLTAQVLLWKHRAAAHKAHTTMAKQKVIGYFEGQRVVITPEGEKALKNSLECSVLVSPSAKGRAERLHREGCKRGTKKGVRNHGQS